MVAAIVCHNRNFYRPLSSTVPEGLSSTDRTICEKEAELELMRKGKRGQRDYFKKLEEGKAEDNEANKKEPKLLVGKLKDVSEEHEAPP